MVCVVLIGEEENSRPICLYTFVKIHIFFCDLENYKRKINLALSTKLFYGRATY